MKVVVVGGGPAGIIAALSAAQCGANVMLLEKNTSLGKKLLITGKGRCNITSSIDISDFIKNIPGNGRFLYSAFQNYTNLDIISLLEKNGYFDMKVKTVHLILISFVLIVVGAIAIPFIPLFRLKTRNLISCAMLKHLW